MERHYRSHEVGPHPLEMIGDLVYSPGTDLPFGKRIQIGLTEETIYESAIEDGYLVGIRAHRAFLEDNNIANPILLDEKQYAMIIKSLLPKSLSALDRGLWRSYFIVGWVCVYLGIAAEDEDIEEEE
ncbi:MAG TPA: hypothetical protein VL461_08705 [Dictyobacter sp.]|nr:hypothetical protein [Dictyobacter sp.]